MRWIDHELLRARTALRRLAARRSPVDPREVRPARLVLRLDDGDLPGSVVGPALSMGALKARVAGAVRWLGPVPVTLRAARTGGSALVLEMVRFIHRLDCPTTLVSDGPGLDGPAALALVDAGLDRACIRSGASPDDAREAILALVAARQERRARLDIELRIPWLHPADRDARKRVEQARRDGVDGFRVVAPWWARDLADVSEHGVSERGALAALMEKAAPFNRTPAATVEELRRMAEISDGEPGLPRAKAGRRSLYRCPVGGQRLELGVDGRLFSCPFKTPIAGPGTEGSSADWVESTFKTQAGSHLEQIRACERACAQVELVPEPILGRPG